MKAAKRPTSHAGCVVAPTYEKYLQKKVAFYLNMTYTSFSSSFV